MTWANGRPVARLLQIGATGLEAYLETDDPEQATGLLRAIQHAGWIELQDAVEGAHSFADLEKVGHIQLGDVTVLATAPGELEIGRVDPAARTQVEAYLVAGGTVPTTALPDQESPAAAGPSSEDASRLTRALLAAHSGGDDAGAAFEELREAVCEYTGMLRKGGLPAHSAMRELRAITRRTLLSAHQGSVEPRYFLDWIVAELSTWCLDEYYRHLQDEN